MGILKQFTSIAVSVFSDFQNDQKKKKQANLYFVILEFWK